MWAGVRVRRFLCEIDALETGRETCVEDVGYVSVISSAGDNVCFAPRRNCAMLGYS